MKTRSYARINSVIIDRAGVLSSEEIVLFRVIQNPQLHVRLVFFALFSRQSFRTSFRQELTSQTSQMSFID